MEHYTYDKKNGLWYKLEGDYYVPCVTVPEVKLTGIWGERRRHFLKDHQKSIYIGMMLADTLETHLQEINTHAEQMFDQLVDQLKIRNGVTEQLKAADQMKWVRRMNAVRHEAAEIVAKELIYDEAT